MEYYQVLDVSCGEIRGDSFNCLDEAQSHAEALIRSGAHRAQYIKILKVTEEYTFEEQRSVKMKKEKLCSSDLSSK